MNLEPVLNLYHGLIPMMQPRSQARIRTLPASGGVDEKEARRSPHDVRTDPPVNRLEAKIDPRHDAAGIRAGRQDQGHHCFSISRVRISNTRSGCGLPTSSLQWLVLRDGASCPPRLGDLAITKRSVARRPRRPALPDRSALLSRRASAVSTCRICPAICQLCPLPGRLGLRLNQRVERIIAKRRLAWSRFPHPKCP